MTGKFWRILGFENKYNNEFNKMEEKNLFLVVGLGNPGEKYLKTRHNVGFRVVDVLANKLSVLVKENKFKGLYALANLNEHKIILNKPQTYMNLSGEAVAPLLRWYKIPPERMIVIYDDLDLPLGKIRIRGKGGAGGHKGILSIINNLGTQDFPRIKIGVGRPENVNYDTADWVLGQFSKQEEEIMTKSFDLAVESIEDFVNNGLEGVMNKYNCK